MKNLIESRFRIVLSILLLVASFYLFQENAAAQRRLPNIDVSSRLVKMKVGEITLESIDFRNQTAKMNLALDIQNTFVPVNLKDFDYRLSLYNNDIIEGSYGALKLNGQRPTRLNLPVTVNLRSIPGVMWQAFRNRGQVQYQLDTGFTLPLYFTEKRFDKSFDGEVPLRSLVSAASILRASQLGR